MKLMGLMHAGKTGEATKLGNQAMQEEWKGMAADDRKMMAEMMKACRRPRRSSRRTSRPCGVLAVDGKSGTLTVKRETRARRATAAARRSSAT